MLISINTDHKLLNGSVPGLLMKDLQYKHTFFQDADSSKDEMFVCLVIMFQEDSSAT